MDARVRFGQLLRKLALDEYPSLAAFARALRVDRSRVSHYIKGEEEGLTYATLENIYSALSDPAARKQLYEAWRKAYAPSPIERLLPTTRSSDEEVVAFAQSIYEYIQIGELALVLDRAKRLWPALLKQGQRWEATMHVGRALVEASYAAGEPFKGLQTAIQMQELARARFEPGWVTIGLWLEAIGLQPALPADIGAPRAALHRLERYLTDWQPRSEDERLLHNEYENTGLRDQLVLSTNTCFLTGDPSDSGNSLIKLQNKLDFAGEPDTLGIFREVIARGQIAVGQYEDAEVTLNSIDPAIVAPSSVQGLKILGTRSVLLLATGDYSEAELEAEKALHLAQSLSIGSHIEKLRRIQRRIATIRRR